MFSAEKLVYFFPALVLCTVVPPLFNRVAKCHKPREPGEICQGSGIKKKLNIHLLK